MPVSLRQRADYGRLDGPGECLLVGEQRRVYEPMLAVVADAVAVAEPAAGYRKLAEAVTSGSALKARRAASTVLGGATTVLTEFLDQMEAQ